MSNENNIVQGVLTTLLTHDDRLKPDVVPQINALYEDESPFRVFIEKVARGGRKAQRSTYKQFKEWPMLRHTTSTSTTGAGAAGAAANLVLANYTHLVAGDVVENLTTGDMFRVTTTPSSTTVATVRFGSNSTNAVASGEEFYLKYPVQRENGSFPDAKSRNTEDFDIQVQQIDRAYYITNWLDEQDTYGISEVERLNRQMLREFRKDEENVLLLGKPVDTTITTKIYGSAGARYYGRLHNLYTTTSGTLSLEDLSNAAIDINKLAGGRNILAICPNWLFDRIGLATFQRDIVRTEQSDSSFQAKIGSIELNSGRWTFIASSTLDDTYADEMILCKPERCGVAELGSTEMYKQGPSELGAYANKYIMSRKLGLHTNLPESFGVIDNIARFEL